MEKMNSIIREKLGEIEKYKGLNQRLMMELEESRQVEGRVQEYEEIIQQM